MPPRCPHTPPPVATPAEPGYVAGGSTTHERRAPPHVPDAPGHREDLPAPCMAGRGRRSPRTDHDSSRTGSRLPCRGRGARPAPSEGVGTTDNRDGAESADERSLGGNDP